MSFYKGNDYYNKGMYEKAKPEYRNAILNGDNVKTSKYNLATCFMKLKEWGNAYQILKNIREENSEDLWSNSDYKIAFNLALSLGNIAEKEGNLEKINQSISIFKYMENNFKCAGCKNEDFDSIYTTLNRVKVSIDTMEELKNIAKEKGFKLDISMENISII